MLASATPSPGDIGAPLEALEACATTMEALGGLPRLEGDRVIPDNGGFGLT